MGMDMGMGMGVGVGVGVGAVKSLADTLCVCLGGFGGVRGCGFG